MTHVCDLAEQAGEGTLAAARAAGIEENALVEMARLISGKRTKMKEPPVETGSNLDEDLEGELGLTDGDEILKGVKDKNIRETTESAVLQLTGRPGERSGGRSRLCDFIGGVGGRRNAAALRLLTRSFAVLESRPTWRRIFFPSQPNLESQEALGQRGLVSGALTCPELPQPCSMVLGPCWNLGRSARWESRESSGQVRTDDGCSRSGQYKRRCLDYEHRVIAGTRAAVSRVLQTPFHNLRRLRPLRCWTRDGARFSWGPFDAPTSGKCKSRMPKHSEHSDPLHELEKVDFENKKAFESFAKENIVEALGASHFVLPDQCAVEDCAS